MATALLKRPDAQMVRISTAGWDVDGPLGRLRARAMALPTVERTGPLKRALGPSLAMLEWSVHEDWDRGSLAPVKAANPASWITLEGLADPAPSPARPCVPALPRARALLKNQVQRLTGPMSMINRRTMSRRSTPTAVGAGWRETRTSLSHHVAAA
jgi:hypothetical protein